MANISQSHGVFRRTKTFRTISVQYKRCIFRTFSEIPLIIYSVYPGESLGFYFETVVGDSRVIRVAFFRTRFSRDCRRPIEIRRFDMNTNNRFTANSPAIKVRNPPPLQPGRQFGAK